MAPAPQIHERVDAVGDPPRTRDLPRPARDPSSAAAAFRPHDTPGPAQMCRRPPAPAPWAAPPPCYQYRIKQLLKTHSNPTTFSTQSFRFRKPRTRTGRTRSPPPPPGRPSRSQEDGAGRTHSRPPAGQRSDIPEGPSVGIPLPPTVAPGPRASPRRPVAPTLFRGLPRPLPWVGVASEGHGARRAPHAPSSLRFLPGRRVGGGRRATDPRGPPPQNGGREWRPGGRLARENGDCQRCGLGHAPTRPDREGESERRAEHPNAGPETETRTSVSQIFNLNYIDLRNPNLRTSGGG